MNEPEPSLWAVIDALSERHGRYRRQAYGFVMAALHVAAEAQPEARRADPERRHLSGGELVESVVALARREFGVMAPTVFREWGLLEGEDVGRIVFQLVEAGKLSARAEDRIEDFLGVPDLLARVAADPAPGSGPARG